MDPARTADLIEDVAHDVAGGGEADSLAAARLRIDEGVDPDDAALAVDERSAAVSRVDRCIGLDVDHPVVRADLSRDRAHDPEGHGVLEPQRAPEGKDELAGAERFRIAQGQEGKTLLVELEHGEVGLEIGPDHHRAHDAPRRLQDGPRSGRSAGEAGERDLDAPRSLDHVGVGDHVAVGVEDHARAARTLLDELAVRRRITRDQDLDHGGLDALAERLEVAAQPGQVRAAAPRSDDLRRRRNRQKRSEKEPGTVRHGDASPPAVQLSGRCTA